MRGLGWIHPFLALALAPLLVGVIHRTKALFAGRAGAPLLQPYHDMIKLLRKGAVYSRTTTPVFRAGPIVALAATVLVIAFVPFGGVPAPLAFPGDFVLAVGLLALARFATVLAALDTGSSFEGMGASREVQVAALAEPALFLSLTAAGLAAGGSSLSGLRAGVPLEAWLVAGPAVPLVAAALFAVLLAENARIPVDDPATHLELTMIHEAMALDHGGPDLAFIQYGAALRLWALEAILVAGVIPKGAGSAWSEAGIFLAAMAVLAALIGVIESSMARLRLARVPILLVGASTFAALALLVVRR